MKVVIRVTESFKKQAKPLLKKFPSLHSELIKLENDLTKDPKMGKPLGHKCYKVRLSVKSKGKGKRGGLRVITLLFIQMLHNIGKQKNEQMDLYLISIYDKNETASISDKELRELITAIINE